MITEYYPSIHTIIRFPEGVWEILQTLNGKGFKAYVVGGCVRDSILGLSPKDWDVSTDATPSQIKWVFQKKRIIETGIRHGTVTVQMDDGQYEVTTFRTDGAYSDSRRPDCVYFVSDISEDLSRRDFTMNAIAVNQFEVVNPFNGYNDIRHRQISCVGNADERFQEDALRMMRALRFASVYNFGIMEETEQAIRRNKDLLRNISAERINSELCKILLGKFSLPILWAYSDVFSVIIPELSSCVGFGQNNKYHQYTVYDHMTRAVSLCRTDDLSVRLAAFLHDIGKPLCYTEDENGGHFYGHAEPSREIAERVLNRLKFDNKTKGEVLELIQYHDTVIEPTPKTVRRWLNKIGVERFKQLLFLREADILAHKQGTQASRLDNLHTLHLVLEDVLDKEQCFRITDMYINGYDVMELGIPEGKEVGEVLHWLLDRVISGELENDRETLMKEAKAYAVRRKS